MAGDRRATAGNLIAQRDIEKVFAADDYSLVGIAGAAGLAIEIVRLYQVELEHYEKIEGTQLTLDGKANRLATMIRGNLGQAHAGSGRRPAVRRLRPRRHRRRPQRGRIFSFDVTGGRYPEQYYHSIGSGSLFAQGRAEEALAPGLDRAERRPGRRRGPLRRRRRRLGDRRPGPHPRHLPGGHARHGRGHRAGSPTTSSTTIVRAILADREARPGCVTPERSRRIMSMPFYASAEQIMRDRSEYARKGIARGRSVVVLTYADGVLFVAENASSRAAQGQRDLRPHRLSPRSASTTSSRTCASPASGSPTCAATPTTAATSPPARWPTPTRRRSARSSPSSRSPTRSRSASPRSAHAADDDQLYRLTYDGTIVDEPEFLVMGGQADAITTELRAHVHRRASRCEDALAVAVGALWARPAARTAAARRCPAAQLEVAVLDRTAASASSGASPVLALTELLPAATAEQRRRRRHRPTPRRTT